MRKTLSVILLAVIMIFVSCTQQNPVIIGLPHVHRYASAWSFDSAAHWHEATCGHDITSGYGLHDFVETIDATGDTAYVVKTCTVCGYSERTEYTAAEEKIATLSNGTESTGYDSIKEAVDAWNEEEDGNYTLTIRNGEYREYDIVIRQKEGRNLTIKAETLRGVVMHDAGEAGKVNHIFYVSGEGNRSGSDTLVIDGIDFHIATAGLVGKDGDTATNNCSIAVRLGKNVDGNAEWYAHNVTVRNCHFYGDPEISYPVYSSSKSDPINITVESCYAEKVKTVYGGRGSNIVLRASEFVDVMSILNSQAEITAPAEGYNSTIEGVTATVSWSEQKDDMYAIRSSGGNVLIKESDIRMENNTEDYAGLVVLRTNAQKVDVVSSYLEMYDHPNTIGRGYIFYNEAAGVEMDVNIDSSSEIVIENEDNIAFGIEV